MDFDFLWILARQPLFRLFGAVIVLLLVDRNLWMGLGAAAVWSVWVAWSVGVFGGTTTTTTTFQVNKPMETQEQIL